MGCRAIEPPKSFTAKDAKDAKESKTTEKLLTAEGAEESPKR